MAGGRSDIQAGKAYVTLYVKNAAFLRGLRNAQRQLSDTGASMMALGRQAAMAGAAMLVPLGFATRTFARFDDGMRAVKAVTQASGEEFKRLTDTAAELGRTTSFTAIEVAGLMTELGRAGFSPDQVNAMTGAVLNLARATGTDATLASGIMAATIRQFGLAAEDSTRVADVLTLAASKTFNTVEMLGEALSYAGPVAADFNMSIEDTAAILGSLGNVGIQASNAGTVLRRLLTITGAEAKNLQKIFGVSFVDAAGNARPLVDTLGEVNEATKDMGTALRAQKFNEAFGLLGITGASALGRVSGETRELAAALRDAEGAAAKMAAEMDGGLGGAARMFMSAFEGIRIAIGRAIDEPLQQVTKSLTKAMGDLTEWIDKNRELVTVAATAGVALVGVGASLVAVGVSLKLAAVGVGVLGVAFKAGAVAMGLFSMIATAVDAAVLTVATVLAICSGAAGSNAAAFVLLSALQAAYPAIAGMVTAAMGILSAAFGANTVAAGIAALAQGALAAASTAAASVVAAAYAVMAAPITPFVVAGVAAVAVMTAIAGVAAVSTARLVDFSGAWRDIKVAIAGAIETAKEVGGVLMAALSAGEYEKAAQALWIGVKIAFHEGADAVVKSFAYMFEQAWEITKAFFWQLLETTTTAMTSLAKTIMNPMGAAEELAGAMGAIGDSSFTFDFASNADAARAELAALKEQIDETVASEANTAAWEKEKAAILAKNAALKAGKKAADEMTERKRLKEEGLTGPQIDEVIARQRVNENLEEQQDDIKDGTEAFKRMTQAIHEQKIALLEGEAAAERYRMGLQKLSPEQILQVEAMNAQRDALEAMRDKSEQRVEAITGAGDKLLAKGMSPAEIAERERKAIKASLESGAIDKQTAEKADAETGQRMLERMTTLREEADRLSQQLKTPQQILNDRLAKISQLQDSGVLSGAKAEAAEDQARKEVQDMIKKQNKKEKVESTGPKSSVATFNAFGAAMQGLGGNSAMERKTDAIRKAIEDGNKAEEKRTDRIVRAVEKSRIKVT